MSALETSRYCCVCKKLFCCAQCRKRHEKNKHPDRQLNCPLCCSEKLPLQNFVDTSLFCHIVTNHLPLYCCLCGEIFEESKDLQSFGACKWFQSRRRHSLISERKSLLETPPSMPDGKRSDKSSLVGEYNSNFETLTSPPELYRNTSTPMIVGQKTSFDFKTPNVPNFSLKTPNTNSAASSKNLNRGIALHACTLESKSTNSETHFLSFTSETRHGETPFRSYPSSNRNERDVNSSRNNSGRKLAVMKEEDKNNCTDIVQCPGDNHCIEDMELTGVEGEVLPDSQSLDICDKPEKRLDSIKKVRFSDQYESQPESSTTSIFNVTENEEYFEARESLSEIGNLTETSQTRINQENERNTEKENQSPDGVNAILNQQQTSGSSRVVMMLVVENNSALTTPDLTPLIDSGLKKLERVVSSNAYPSISNLSDRTSPNCTGTSVTSVDSYYSVSNYECYSTSSSTSSSSYREPRSSPENKESAGSGGIFSAVAQAVRSVMKNLSGTGTSRNIAREQVSQREDIVASTATIETSNALTNLTSSLLRRPGKRPRDISEASSSSSRHVDFVVPQLEPRSPLAKRHRGWYRIKGREPIMRMRNNRVTSPRGISSETQVFSQGSLSVGDTVLPLPVRAHQSTQTE